jgi:two-component system, chemotaxis family, protein-glutamate methylesterase/glutaminase
MKDLIRVLVVDDSALMRKLIPQALQTDPGIEVVATAMDGNFALKKIREFHPDVVTLDLDMPEMDGMETLRQIMRGERVPVIVVSSHSSVDTGTALKALSLGALDFVAKPEGALAGNIDSIRKELIQKVRVAAASGMPQIVATVASSRDRAPRKRKPAQKPAKVIAIGVSTGGPNALQYLFSHLPEDFPGSLIVVQHMPEGFTAMFAKRLDEQSPIEVKEAQSGDVLIAGRALICPGNRHIRIHRMTEADVVVLTDQPPLKGHRPSVDVLFRSIAREYGREAAAVIMTGMGDDGADGICEVYRAGGLTLAQSLDTCVVESMPRSAIDRGCVTRVVPLSMLALQLQGACVNARAPAAIPVVVT